MSSRSRLFFIMAASMLALAVVVGVLAENPLSRFAAIGMAIGAVMMAAGAFMVGRDARRRD